jgi:hypothetical protein
MQLPRPAGDLETGTARSMPGADALHLVGDPHAGNLMVLTEPEVRDYYRGVGAVACVAACVAVLFVLVVVLQA